MKMYFLSGALVCVSVICFVSTGASASHVEKQGGGDAVRGAELFRNECGLCHQGAAGDGEGGAGPDLRGIVGRKVGGDAGFPYSQALANSDEIWTAESLERFLADPAAAFPGNYMPTNVPSAADREDIVAYLAGLPAPD